MILLTDARLRRWPLPRPTKGGSKEHRGRALIIAGGVEMPGAAILASTAALRAGCGKVRVAISKSSAAVVGSAVPELFVLPIASRASLRAVIESAKEADTVLIGPGMRDVAAIRFLLPQLLRLGPTHTLIVDATALRLLSGSLRGTGLSRIILTPHHSEAAALCGVSPEKIERAPLRYGRDIARRFHAVVVLKSAETIICCEQSDDAAYVNKRGNPGLATAGSGDVLAGIIAGLSARGAGPVQAAAWAVALHARAGEQLAKRIGPLGYVARELPEEIPRLLTKI
jgi:ADP-dependent NAD(P)H-hydrate dehydratase